MGQVDGRVRVIPGDAACSVLTERIEGADGLQIMPPGGALPASARCAIEQWIQGGASK